MRKTWMKAIAVAVAGGFTCAVFFCCHGHSLIDAKQGEKGSCCHAKPTKADPASKANCGNCPIVTKSVDSAQIYALAIPAQLSNLFVAVQVPYLPQLNLNKSLFNNGPPGPVVQVPLYILSRSLRI